MYGTDLEKSQTKLGLIVWDFWPSAGGKKNCLGLIVAIFQPAAGGKNLFAPKSTGTQKFCLGLNLWDFCPPQTDCFFLSGTKRLGFFNIFFLSYLGGAHDLEP